MWRFTLCRYFPMTHRVHFLPTPSSSCPTIRWRFGPSPPFRLCRRPSPEQVKLELVDSVDTYDYSSRA